jgi:hypothetical protein
MVNSRLEGNLNGVAVLARNTSPVWEARKEMVMGLDRRGGGSCSRKRMRRGVSRMKVTASNDRK